MTDDRADDDPRSSMGGHPRALIESSLERVLESTVFRRSDRHRRFMRYVVQAALDGRSETLKEVLIGIELFGRRLEAYDPRTDPIVRVEAGRIRAKLTRYYLSEGSSDRFGFDIPSGGYVPRFEKRQARAPRRPVETYAVMPFAAREGDDLQFAIGLADQLINLLGRVRDVRVVARVSAFKARERGLDVRETARLLKVTRIVDGSFQRRGERMRCIAHIYEGGDGTRVWSQSFDSMELAAQTNQPIDFFAFQDHVAEVVVSAALPTIDGTLSPQRPAPRIVPPEEISAEALRESRRSLDQATYLYRRFETSTCDQMIALAEAGSRLDPGTAQGHSLLARACFQKVTLNLSPGSALRPRIESALARALDLDPADTDALALDAMLAFRFAYDWRRAERLFERALRVSPHANDIHYRYAFCLIVNGRFHEGRKHLQTAIDLDPLNLAIRASAAQLVACTGDLEGGRALARAVLEVEPQHLFTNIALGLIHLYGRAWDDARACFDRAIALSPDPLFACFGRIASLGFDGRIAEGTAELDALVERLDGRYYPRYGLALALLGLGRRTEAYEALERAAIDRDTTFCSVAHDPLFAPCRADPAFVALLERHGLAAPPA